MADHYADLPKFYLLLIDWLIDWEIGSVWFWKIDSLSKKAWFLFCFVLYIWSGNSDPDVLYS